METISRDLCTFEGNTIKNFKAITTLLLNHLFTEEVASIKRSIYSGKVDPDSIDDGDLEKLNLFLQDFAQWEPYKSDPELIYYLGKITNVFYDFPSISFTLAIPILEKQNNKYVSIIYHMPVFLRIVSILKMFCHIWQLKLKMTLCIMAYMRYLLNVLK